MGDLTFRALDPSTWPDLIELFQTHDNPRSCWCQFWRLSIAEWKASDRGARGARVVEGYPVIRPLRPDGTPIGAPFRFMGDPSIYRRAGFVDVAPSGQARRLMR